MATLSYVAESHDHLGSVSLTLWYQGGTTSKLRLASAGDAVETHSITVGHVGDDASWKLRMPVSVTKSFQLDISLSADQERYDVRVPSAAHASPSATQSFIHRPPLSGRDLSDLKPTSFACSTCSASILTPSPTVTYADLPSEYWTEMLEAWMCHPEGNFLHQLKESRMRPTDGQILVGNDYLLVAEAHLRTSGQPSCRVVQLTILDSGLQSWPHPGEEATLLQWSFELGCGPGREVRQASLAARIHFHLFFSKPSGQSIAVMLEEGPWAPEATRKGTSNLLTASASRLLKQVEDGTSDRLVHCKCGKVIGSTSPAAEGIVKLDKRRISVTGQTGQSLQYTVDWYLAADLLERAQAHSSRRFILQETETGKRRFLLWLFQPMTRITYSKPLQATSHSGGDNSARTVIKLMWLDMQATDSSTLNLSQAETITYPSDSIDEIAKHLSGAHPDWWMNGQDGFGMYRSAFMPRT